MKEIKDERFPYLEAYSKHLGSSPEILVEAFKVENHYHKEILKEHNQEKRGELYEEFYSKLLKLYGRNAEKGFKLDDRIKMKDLQVTLFGKELKNKSIIDFGCGEGCFLMNLQRNLPNKSLTGVDVFIPESLEKHEGINFIAADITNFRTEEKYDVAFSDNVIEHLHPEDAFMHIKSVFKALKPGGKFILVMPNKLFGPADITRIIDNSSSGKVLAQGGHLNESTYTEMIEKLTEIGFTGFQTVLPVPKLKYSLFKNIRINPSFVLKIEKSDTMLKFFRAFKFKGRCPIRFTVTLVCKVPD